MTSAGRTTDSNNPANAVARFLRFGRLVVPSEVC